MTPKAGTPGEPPEHRSRASIAALIRARREHLGLTREQVAEFVGRNFQQVGRWERAESLPEGSETRSRLAEILHLEADDFIPDGLPEDAVLEMADQLVALVDGLREALRHLLQPRRP